MKSTKNQLRAGAIWTATGQFGSAFLQWAQLAALAWLLPPSDFGLMAVAQTTVGFVAPMTDLGLFQAIVYQPVLTENQRSTLFWINVLVGFAFFLSFLGLGFAFSELYAQPVLQPLMSLLGLVFLLIPLGSERAAMLSKNLEFGIISRIEIVSRVASLLVSVAAAFAGWGVFALAAGPLSRHIFSVAGFRFFGKKHGAQPIRRVFFWSETKPLLTLGLFESAAKCVNFAQSNLDKFIVGKWLGMAELGIYQLAWNLAVAPISFILPALSRISGPFFAKIQQKSPDQVARNYERFMFIAMMTMLPAYAFLSVAATEIVAIFFGEKWAAAAPVLAILAAVFAVRSMGVLGASLLMARRKPEIELWWNLGFGTFVNVLIVLFLMQNAAASSVAWAHLTAVLAGGWAWHFSVSKVGNVSYRGIFGDFLTILACLVLPMILIFGFFDALIWPPIWLVLIKFLLLFTVAFLVSKKIGLFKKLVKSI